MELRTEITRVRAPITASDYGNRFLDWSSPTEETFSVHWSPKSASEVVGDEPQTVTKVKIFGFTLDIEATDRVIGPDGNTYEVDGDVMRSYDPRTGQLHHVRAFLRRISIPGGEP